MSSPLGTPLALAERTAPDCQKGCPLKLVKKYGILEVKEVRS